MSKLLSFVACALFAGSIYAQEVPHIDGQLIVQLTADGKYSDITKDLAYVDGKATSIKAVDELSSHMRAWLFEYNAQEIEEDAMYRAFDMHPQVQIVQYNHLVQLRETTPNDLQFEDQWHHVNGNDSDIDSDLAWDITTGGTTAFGDEIVVCVIEGGNLLHPDLDPNRWVNENEIPDDGVDNDNNGFVDDYDGWNVNSEDDGGVFNGGHGTNVAGMIGAVGDNETGVAGINWDVKIMSVAGESLGNEASVIEAYNYPLVQRKLYDETGGERGAFVVATNASWGIDGGDPATIPLWCAFYDTLGTYGILNCGATANNNVNIDQVGDIPTACTSPYMVSVTATNNNDERTFSAYGATMVDLGAPGESVWTTSGSDGYTSTSGTSFASPLTAGAIALLYSVPCPSLMSIIQSDPQTGADLILSALYEGVDPVEQLQSETVTGGRLNVNNSLNILIQNCSSTECLVPFGVNANTSDGVDYTITWGSIESMESFSIRYREVGADEWITVADLTEASYELDELLWCSDYEFQLSANCADDMSDWSETYFIATDGCCTPPGDESITVSNISETGAIVQWESILAATAYELILSDGDGVETVISDLDENSYTFSDLEPCASFTVAVQSICQGNEPSGYSGTLEFNTFGCGACTDNSYCEAIGFSDEEYVQRVVVGDIDNLTGAEVDGYGDYTNISTDLERGEEYSIDLIPGFPELEYNEYFIVWLDYDQNGFFIPSEKIFESEDAIPEPQEGTFIIPEDAPIGSTRLRISMSYAGFFFSPQFPCDELEYGEIEDYCINIIEGTVGVDEVEGLINSVYPNPSNADFTFELREIGQYQVDFYDLSGRTVKSMMVNTDRFTVDLGELPEGIYTYRISDNSSFRDTGKVILMK